MKYVLLIIALVVCGYFAYQEVKPLPPPPPPPPPMKAQPVISPEDLAKVIRSSADENSDVRWQALLFLNKVATPQTDAIIFARLHNDPKSAIREKIAHEILSTRGGPEITQNLIWALKDPSPTVRVAVLQALSQVADLAAAPNVTAALKDKNEAVRQQALKTLTALQEKQAALVRQQQEEAQHRYEEEKRKRENKWFSFEN